MQSMQRKPKNKTMRIQYGKYCKCDQPSLNEPSVHISKHIPHASHFVADLRALHWIDSFTHSLHNPNRNILPVNDGFAVRGLSRASAKDGFRLSRASHGAVQLTEPYSQFTAGAEPSPLYLDQPTTWPETPDDWRPWSMHTTLPIQFLYPPG